MVRCLLTALLIFPSFLVLPAAAEEGMWTFNRFPSETVRQKYGFAPTQQWLDKVRLSSVRLAAGCSASFVSENGLVLTNHHCAAACIQELSTADNNLSAKGYHAKTAAEEKRCPQQEANVLMDISDVTARISGAIQGRNDQAANEARKGEIARIEKECASSDALRCEVVSLYGGGVYNLYKYRRYQDLRLVFAPEFAIAFFGGDPDNFNFPRYDLDVSFLRVYENGQPLKTPNHFSWSPAGAKEGELTFTSGHPGGTDRQLTVAMLETERDFSLPFVLFQYAEYRGVLSEFQTRGEEQKRVAQDELFGIENSYKALKGEFESLLVKPFFQQKVNEEADFRKRISANPKLHKEFGSVWDELAAADKKKREQYTAYAYFERGSAFRSDLFRHARRLIRMAEEFSKPNEKRLENYTDARKPELVAATLSPAPVYPELEIETLTFSLTKLREALGPDDPRVRQLFGKRSPREVATAAVQGTKLTDLAVRKALFEGGKSALEAASGDSMLAFARAVDPVSRAIRKQYEDEVESAIVRGSEKLAKARFAVYGTAMYPDATFTLRLSYGSVKGWMEKSKPISPFTIFGGAFERNTGSDPFALPQSWLDSKDKLNLQTPFNFTTTNDIIGGNSGSPVINKDAQIAGLIFDGNIHSLGGNYGFDASLNRAVAVHSQAIIEALTKIYKADRILAEIQPK